MGKLMLNQDICPEVTDTEDMVIEVMEDMVMDVDTMARGRLKLKLSQDILGDMDMVIEAMVDMDMVVMVMVVDTMARGRLKLSQDILEDMVDMDIVVMVMVVDTAIMVE